MAPIDDSGQSTAGIPHMADGPCEDFVLAHPSINATSATEKLITFFKSQRARLKSLSVLLVCRFVTAGLGFATTIQIANGLGKAVYGELAYALALGLYGSVVVRYGLNRTLIRDLIHDPQHFDALVVGSVVLRVVMLGIVVAGLVIGRICWNPISLSWPVTTIIMFYCLRSLDLQPVYDAWHQFNRHAMYDLIERCLYYATLWSIILIAPTELGLTWIGWATGLSIIFYMILQYHWAFRRVTWQIDVQLLLRTVVFLLRQNVWMWFATIAALSFGSLNQIILRRLRDVSELGGYAVGWQLVVVADVLLLNVSRIGNPATAKITRAGVSAAARCRFMKKYVGIMLAAATPFCVPALICPKLILATLFRPEYATAAPIVRILGGYVLLHSVAIPICQYMISTRMEKTYLISVTLDGILTIGLSCLLIPEAGGIGAALALLIPHGGFVVVCLAIMIRHMRRTH